MTFEAILKKDGHWELYHVESPIGNSVDRDLTWGFPVLNDRKNRYSSGIDIAYKIVMLNTVSDGVDGDYDVNVHDRSGSMPMTPERVKSVHETCALEHLFRDLKTLIPKKEESDS